MKLLFASDSFKGTLQSSEIAQLLTRAAGEVFVRPDCQSLAVADGGEGTIDAIIDSVGGKIRTINVNGPFGKKVDASYAILGDGRVFIEMAQASGLTLVPKDERNPMLASTFGTGQLILDAINQGFGDITISIGGSATNDGGLGCLRALGARLYAHDGALLQGCGADLLRLAAIDTSEVSKRLAGKRITVMCDVNNALCGPLGATRVFAAQKGATLAQIELLEQGMENYRNIIRGKFGIDPNDVEGSGAAGGLGAALIVALGGTKQSGIDSILQMTQFESKISDVDYVVTGEGCLDSQSCFGKVISGVARVCKRHGVKVVALAGKKGEGWEEIHRLGISKVFAVTDYFSLHDSLSNPRETYYETAKEMFKVLKNQYMLS
ncbi:MAG: glycerate kinase [Muribaculaceae bacterium]